MLETSKQIKDHKMLFKLNDTLQQNQKFIKKLKKQVSCSIVRDQQIIKRNCYLHLSPKMYAYVYTKVYIVNYKKKKQIKSIMYKNVILQQTKQYQIKKKLSVSCTNDM